MPSPSFRHLPLVVALLGCVAYLSGCCCCPLPTDFIGLRAPGRNALPDVRHFTAPAPHLANPASQRY
ncbi:MAG: hypothetical protein ACO3JL_05250 [Myxococcota bacterium]